MTNRELPALPEWMDSYSIPCDAFDGGDGVRLSDRMRAYGSFCYERGYATASLMMAKSAQLPKQGESVELCRAAPAGGDARTVPFSDWMEAQHELGELRTMLARSAPAGSGEVSDGCTESNCERCATAPHARGDLRHAGLGSYPDVTHISDKAAWLERAAAKWEVGPMAINPADALRLRELAALLRKLQQGADYVMVPREPTREMCLAANRACAEHPIRNEANSPVIVYRAMIAASQDQEGGANG